MIHHHLDPTLLYEYAAGTCDPPRALLVATHLTLCPACRTRLSSLEVVGAALAGQSPPEPEAEDGIDAVFARLDAPSPAPPSPRFDADGVLPGPLASLVGPFSALPWRWKLPGVEEIVLPVASSGMPARLYRLQPGMRVPDHGHTGQELSLVLTGGFTDDEGHFLRGDVADRGEGVHRQRIDPGDPCVVLIAADGPLTPRSALAWIASWFGTF